MADQIRRELPFPQRWMLGLIALGIPLSAWGALYPENTWLQVGPVGLGLVLAVPMLRRWPLSNTSAAMLTAFLLLHLFAARWSYSYVPYDAWARDSFGRGLGEIFGWQRNMFDRVVHFLFGVLILPVVSEITIRHSKTSHRFALVFAAFFVFGLSSLYEIFEWSLTMSLAPADAGAYNGEQGDPFDSQKDMAWAAIGAILAIPLTKRLLRSEFGHKSDEFGSAK